MFGGSYTHSLDSAGRFIMPKKFRHSLGENFVITRGLGCLCVFTEDFVNQQLVVELQHMGTPLQSLLNPDIVRLTRHFFNDMVTTSTDGQNRVLLTPEHMKFAGITDTVIVSGTGTYIELWSPEAYEQYKQGNLDADSVIASGAVLKPLQPRPGESDAGVSQAGPG